VTGSQRLRPVLAAKVAASLVLVRHGESTYIAEGRFQGRHDPPLSVLGERQAALVAARLADRASGAPLPLPAVPPTGIWHSPLRRAATTAQAIAAAQPVAVELLPTEQLTEVAQGQWEGQLSTDVKANWPTELAAWRRQPALNHAPGGEALVSAARRVAAGVHDILAALTDGQRLSAAPDPVPGYRSARLAAEEPWAIVVAHDGVFRLAVLALLDLPLNRFWSVPFNLCAITVVGVRDGVATLRAHNLSEHLAPLSVEASQAPLARPDRGGAL
jgi:broad specificity phosphatase PhoE